MNRGQIKTTTEQLMSQTSLWESRYRGLLVGPLVATICSQTIMRHVDGVESVRQQMKRRRFPGALKNHLVRYRRSLPRSIGSLFRRLILESKNVDVVFLGMTTDRFLHEGDWTDVFISPYKDWFAANNYTTMHFEYSVAGELRLPHRDHTIEIDLIILLIAGVNAVVRRLSGRSRVIDTKATNFIQACASVFQLPYREMEQKVNETVRLTWHWYFFWHLLFRILKPKVAFVITYYSPIGWGLSAACRSADIKVVDVQHGGQGPYHAAYGMYSVVPPGVRGNHVIPSHYWVWSEDERDAILSWSNGVTQPIVGGNVWLEKTVREVRDRNSVDLNSKERYEASILVTLQPNRPLPDWFRIVLENRPEWRFVIRLHPSMHGSLTRTLHAYSRFHNVEIDSGAAHITTALRKTDVHATIHSTTVLEAAKIGVPSIVIGKDPGAIVFSDLIRQGKVIVVENAGQFVGAVQEVIMNLQDDEYVFKKTTAKIDRSSPPSHAGLSECLLSLVSDRSFHRPSAYNLAVDSNEC